MINKEQLKEILKDLHEVAKDYIDNKTIFKEACSYQRGLMCGESRVSNYQKPKIVNPDTIAKGIDRETKPNSIKASDKQKSLMTKLHIPFTDKTSIKEAKELIEIKLGKKEYKEY